MKKVVIYTDWSCLWNPWPGGWACFLKFWEKEKILSGWSKETTNNQMELTALIKALEQLKTDKYLVEIWTDSKYVLDGITKWIDNWKTNNWKTKNKQDVKNKELWEKLDNLMQKFNTEIYWVKAHNTDDYNNMVDELARKEAEKIKNSI